MSLAVRYIVDGWYIVIGINPTNNEIKYRAVAENLEKAKELLELQELDATGGYLNYFTYRINSSEVM